MSPSQPLVSLRRRPMPGMASGPPDAPTTAARAASDGDTAAELPPAGAGSLVKRRAAADYGATRLVNFRLPVDLHDRYRQLVHDAERAYPRVRRPSLTELVIALLEEGPQTAAEVAEVIRRKRAAEHQAEV